MRLSVRFTCVYTLLDVFLELLVNILNILDPSSILKNTILALICICKCVSKQGMKSPEKMLYTI